MHALIIEDELLIAMSIEDALRDCGYSSFAFATSVAQAVDAARFRCPMLISADVDLSPGCGIDAVAAICTREPIPVIFVTGTPGDVELRRPGSVIVHKPFKHSDIKRAVERLFPAAPTGQDKTFSGDIEYYRKRAAAERLLAFESPGNEAAAIHEALADQYEALASDPRLRSEFRIKWSASTVNQQLHGPLSG